MQNSKIKYTFSESLGYKLMENYDEFKNSSSFFQKIKEKNSCDTGSRDFRHTRASRLQL
jgi:hypothetical protein